MPSFKRCQVLSGLEDGLVLDLVVEMEPMAAPMAVGFGDMRVL